MKARFFTLTAVLLMALATNLSAEPSPEKLDAIARGLVNSLNNDDKNIREQYLKKNYINADSSLAIERWLGHFQRYSNELGQIEVHSVDITDPLHLQILIRSANPRNIRQWMTLGLNMDSAKTDKFRSMSLGPGDDPTIVLPDRPLTETEIADYVRAFVADMATRDVFAGTASLAKNGKPFYSGAYGKANRRWGIGNKLDTKFNLGSMNKMFTGVAICQLAEQNKLSFDDKIIKHLPDYPNKEVANKVTIHHLLTHTSGMASYWDAMSKMDWTTLRSVKDFADLTVNDTLLFNPGAKFHYSNSGPLVLGLIIEKISGMDYHEYIRKNISEPAGMTNTDCYEADAVVPNLAQGYYWNDETGEYCGNIFAHSARGSAAGGGFSTVEDLHRFAKALYDGTLLSNEMVKTYTTGKVDMGPGDKYAYLIGDNLWDGHRTVGHSGGAPGINADLKIFPDLGYTITAMSNTGSGASAITDYAARLITHKRRVPN